MKGRRARPTFLLPALVALLAGCGGDGGGPSPSTGPDPATVSPADAALFAEGVVRPDGDRKQALDSALSKLLATDDPGALVVDRLDEALASGDTGLTYRDDIEPWLGERAGFFLRGSQGETPGAAVIATTDPAVAQRAIDKAAAADEQPERRRSYQGVDYLVDRDGTAAGLVGDFVVAGTQRAFRDAVDASKQRSLAESGEFEAQLDQAPQDWVGFLYLEPRKILDDLQKSGIAAAAEASSATPRLEQLLGQPVSAAISASSDQLALQASAAAGAAPASQESELLKGFPEESWLAFAIADVGETYGSLLRQVRPGAGAADARLGGGLGSELADQISRWAGDLGGFITGTSLFSVGGALVVQTDDEQASATTLDRLRRALGNDPRLSVEPLTDTSDQGFSFSPAGVPISFTVVQHDDKVVAGLAASVEDVLSPSSTLDDSDAFNSGADALGDDFAPQTFIDFVPLLELIESFPQARDDPDYRSAKPYLDHLDYFVLGTRSDGDRAELRMVLGLRDAPAETGGDSGTAAAVVGE
ncbi:MAG TPA: DUF3352 domain-containing protein [Solirubrobacterales bacterium]|nr:DUF3352 domain-containing protein [Solirubrobacterales bacterium]